MKHKSRNSKENKQEQSRGKGTRENGKEASRGRNSRDNNQEQSRGRNSRDNNQEQSRGRNSRDNNQEQSRGRNSRDNNQEQSRGRNPRDNNQEHSRGRNSRDNNQEQNRGRSFNRNNNEGMRYKIDYNEGLQLEGRNAILEALNSDRTIDKIYVKQGEVEGSIKVIIAKAKEKGIVIQEVSKLKLDEMSQTYNHQGVIGMCPAHEYAEVSDILNIAKKKGEDPFIIILDNIKDPHNLGAIIRTAECCGAHGIIIPKRRAVGITGVVSKVSAGAIEYLPVAKVTNIAQVLDTLKKEGLWIVAGETHGKPYFKGNLKGAMALVIGSEDEGISKLVSKKCDFSVKIPMYGEISSLNASVAAGLLMYEVVRQRNFTQEIDNIEK